jgi:hypothetical protein
MWKASIGRREAAEGSSNEATAAPQYWRLPDPQQHRTEWEKGKDTCNRVRISDHITGLGTFVSRMRSS